jgi:hypothetical protein
MLGGEEALLSYGIERDLLEAGPASGTTMDRGQEQCRKEAGTDNSQNLLGGSPWGKTHPSSGLVGSVCFVLVTWADCAYAVSVLERFRPSGQASPNL